jgi:hypothetical protein
MAEGFYFSGASFSACSRYRYSLSRAWDPHKPTVGFIMLNPSTADAEVLDPTVRRCVGYARAWGYGALEVANIFAWRSTDPKALLRVEDPVGPENDHYICDLAKRAHLLIAAWGTHGVIHGRGGEVLRMLIDRDVHTLGLTKSGYPKHPLYLGKGVTPALSFPELVSRKEAL